MSKPSISYVMHCCIVLLFLLSTEHAMGESFSIHLVHPDNDAIVSSVNSDVDLQDYIKVVFPQEDKIEILWINKQVEIDINDLEEATLKWNPEPLRIPFILQDIGASNGGYSTNIPLQRSPHDQSLTKCIRTTVEQSGTGAC